MDRTKQAYDFLKKAILNHEIGAGEPLREIELAEKMNISRTPIREALRQLEREGVVINYPSRGSFVTTLTPYDVEEIYDLRIMLELYALDKAFNRITTEDLDRVEKLFVSENNNFDFERYHEADRALHQLFFDKCGNKRAVTFMETLNIQIERVRKFSDEYTLRTNESRLQEHLSIIGYIRQHDAEKCKQALTTHLRHVADAAIETCRMLTSTGQK